MKSSTWLAVLVFSTDCSEDLINSVPSLLSKTELSVEGVGACFTAERNSINSTC